MFFEILCKLCEEHNISITNLALNLGISKSNVTNWKNGSIPKSDKIAKIAEYFDVSTDYLLGNTDIKNKPIADDGDRLTKGEQELINMLRLVPEGERDMVIAMIESALKHKKLL